MADTVKQLLAKSIQLAEQVSKAADEVSKSFKQECLELKSVTEKLAALLHKAANTSSDLLERPARRIIGEAEQALEKALTLVLKCRENGLMNRVFSILQPAAPPFRKMSRHLENSIGDVSYLLMVSAPEAFNRDEYFALGLPTDDSNLGLIWGQIAILEAGSLDDRSDAADALLYLARDNDRGMELDPEIENPSQGQNSIFGGLLGIAFCVAISFVEDMCRSRSNARCVIPPRRVSDIYFLVVNLLNPCEGN